MDDVLRVGAARTKRHQRTAGGRMAAGNATKRIFSRRNSCHYSNSVVMFLSQHFTAIIDLATFRDGKVAQSVIGHYKPRDSTTAISLQL